MLGGGWQGPKQPLLPRPPGVAKQWPGSDSSASLYNRQKPPQRNGDDF